MNIIIAKKTSFILAVICLFLVSCSAQSVSPDSVTEKIMAGITLPEMTEIGQENIQAHYSNMDLSLLDAYSVYKNTADGSVAEIAVFSVKDKANIKIVNAALSEIVGQKLDSYKNSDNVMYNRVKNGVIASRDRYVLFAICEQPNTAKKIFEENTPK